MKKPQTIFLKKLLGILSLVLGLVIVFSILITVVAGRTFSRGNFSSSKKLFRAVAPITTTTSKLTDHYFPLVEVWQEGVWLGQRASELQLEVASLNDVGQKIVVLNSNLEEISFHFQQFTEAFQSSWLISLLVADHQLLSIQLTAFQQFLAIGQQIFTSNDQFLLLLQNTDELRATGGFIGSYAVLDFSLDNPFEIEMRDIYDPSGISITLPAPAGQAKYLSEGLGMKLHDANWSPDFPTSAQLILRYFSGIQGDPQSYDGVVALPLSVIESLVGAVDGIYIPDQDRVINATEFAQIIRQDRQAFFPGSKEKEQSLQHFYTALLLRFTQLSVGEWRQVLGVLSSEQLLSEIQLFAKDPVLQQSIEQLGLSGESGSYSSQQLFVFPVESNVGINKANRKVSRTIYLTFNERLLTVTTNFHNQYTVAERPVELQENPLYTTATHLGYANYYRLLVRPDMRVKNITIDDQYLGAWDEEIIISSGGTSYLQIGFLVIVPEEKQVTVAVQFKVPDILSPEFVIQKQVGMSYDKVVITCGEQQISLPLSGNLFRGTCPQEVE